MLQKEISSKLIEDLRKAVPSARLPEGIGFYESDWENAIEMRLSADAVVLLNMQENAVAFEAWALILHVHLGRRVILALDHDLAPNHSEDSNNSEDLYRGHCGRFLYRAKKFHDQYGKQNDAWFDLSDDVKKQVEGFKTCPGDPKFVNNYPTTIAKDGLGKENQVEGMFADVKKQSRVLADIAAGNQVAINASEISRQLPVGLFEGTVSKDKAVFPYGKSAIDLWTVTEDSIVIFELKTDNQMVGIITELMFYANYVYDMFIINGNTFSPQTPENEAYFRGYRRLINSGLKTVLAAMLTNGLHPLVTPEVIEMMNAGAEGIKYLSMKYRFDGERLSAE